MLRIDRMRSWLYVCVTLSLSLLPVSAQTPSRLTFEVATVRLSPAPPGPFDPISGGPGTATPGQITYRHRGLLALLMEAYSVQPYLISGPTRTWQESWDIVANVPAGATKEQVKVMLQNLLADRFQIKLHHETKSLTSYEATVSDRGSKLKLAEPGGSANDRMEVPTDHGSIFVRRGSITGAPITNQGIRMAGFAAPISSIFPLLEDALGRSPIIDKTGLTGLYTFTLDFDDGYPQRPGSTEVPFPKVPEALERQLGLKLTKGSGQFDALVIDSAEKVPTAN